MSNRVERVRRTWGRSRVALAALCAVLAAAPTVGDIGSCGQEPVALDASKFFAAKASRDCQACSECGIATQACTDACEGPVPVAFAPSCFPLVHDGEVCLNALGAASCDDYISYMADEGATTPTECNFCPGASPVEAPGNAGGTGAAIGGAGGVPSNAGASGP